MASAAILDAQCHVAKDNAAPLLWRGVGSLLELSLPASRQLRSAPQRKKWTLLKLITDIIYHTCAVWRWTAAICQMVVYVALLLPGFLQMVAFYVFSPRVYKNVAYGSGARQQLDLYMPPAKTGRKGVKHPVVIFLTGGAWTIGYKAWGAILARRLSSRGMLVVCLDYRNYPQGTALQMLEDVNTGIAWVCANIGGRGGDPDDITLVGQSAGAHLGALALFRQAEQMATGSATLGASPAWSPSSIRGFVGVSGPYDLAALSEHLHKRGLCRNLVETIMSIDGEPALRELSPLEAAKAWAPGTAELIPEFTLLHGTADKSSPCVSSAELHEVLKSQHVRCDLQLVDGKGHTSFLLEDPMKGGRDRLAEVVLRAMHGLDEAHEYPRMCPALMCELAGWICPF